MKNILLEIYRLRLIVGFGAFNVGVVAVVADLLIPGAPDLLRWLPMAVAVLLLLAAAVSMLGTRLLPRYPVRSVQAPVRGRWLAMNSPATKVPSHGVRAYGQAFAIDLVYEPLNAERPAFGQGPAMRQPEDFPAFGQPVLAMVDGTVVAASGGHGDHRSRSSAIAVAYMLLDGMLRELGGPGFVVGNHVTIRTSDGVYALVAHLRRGSLRVAVGDAVRAGDHIGDCGNTGNSSEPHVHAQLMDRRSLIRAQGIPMQFENVTIGESTERRAGMPADDEHMTAQPSKPPARLAGTSLGRG